MIIAGSEVGLEFVRTRQGFHEYVAKDVRRDFPIVDFNVSGIYEPHQFAGFTEVERAYADLEENLSPDEQNHDVIAQKIAADTMVLRILRGDEEIDPAEMFEATVGFVPEAVPEEEIKGMFKALDYLLFAYSGIRYDQDGWPKFKQGFLYKRPEDIEREFRAFKTTARLAVRQYVEVPQDFPNPEMQNDEDIPWTANVTTDNNGQFMMQANIHPSRRYTQEKIRHIWLHEGAHIAQGRLWQNLIRRGTMSPACGLTSYTSPENTHQEILAAFSETSLPEVAETEDQKTKSRIRQLYSELSTAVWHNAHLKVQDGKRVEGVAEEVKHLLPFEDPQLIDKVVADCQNQPLVKIFVPSYRYAHERAAEIALITDPSQRRKVVNALYTGALTLAQVQATISANQHKNWQNNN